MLLHSSIQLGVSGTSAPAVTPSQRPPVHMPHTSYESQSNTPLTYQALSCAQNSSRQELVPTTGRPLEARNHTCAQQGPSTVWPWSRRSEVSQALHASLLYLYFHCCNAGSRHVFKNIQRKGRDGIPTLFLSCTIICIFNQTHSGETQWM